MSQQRFFLFPLMGVLLLMIGSTPKSVAAQGGLSLSQTRVVFNEKAQSTTVTLNNQSDRVYLIQGRISASPETAMSQDKHESVPFMVTPPLFRLEKESKNTVRLIKQGASTLPSDRESVFYVSFLAIPSVKKTEDVGDVNRLSQVNVGIRAVIKLFYRPSGLSLPVAAAPEKLTFSRSGARMMVRNPTPYYLTLAQLTINHHPVDVREQGAMIAPYSEQSYTTEMDSLPHREALQWSVINDYGGISGPYHAALNGQGG